MSSPASSSYYETHGQALRGAVAERLRAGEEPLVALLHEHMRLDPLSGEHRVLPVRNQEMLRLYFQFLRDNERLPLGSQIPLHEIKLVWETLLAFFGESELEQDKIGQVFRLIQRKMEAGLIAQAWLLLNIFDYQRSVRLDNERSLFLEEMALLFSKRQDMGQRAISPELHALLEQAAEDASLLPEVAERLAAELGIRLLVLREDAKEQAGWAAVWLQAGSQPSSGTDGGAQQGEEGEAAPESVDASPAELLPPLLCTRKWRPPTCFSPETDEGLLAALHSPESVRAYCDALLKGVYFLILITESTGYEEFLTTFIEWLRTLVGPEAMRVFSTFHAKVTLDEKTINESLEAVFTSAPLDMLTERVATVSGAELAAAARDLFAACASEDLLAVAPGNYSLDGLLLDRCLGFSMPRFDLSWRLHRLL